MTAAPTITAWAIKAPDGWMWPYAFRTRKEAIASHTNDMKMWRYYRLRYGYRCVRVQITEMEEGK